MKKSKLFSILASLAMALSLMAMPMNVNAAADPIAKIGNKEYSTLGDAVDAANENETITIIKSGNISGVKIKDGKTLTIDFNGNTVSVVNPMVGSSGTETNCFQLLKGSNVTLKNGTIKTTDQSSKIFVQNYCNLTLDNITLDASECSTTQYVLSNNCGNVTIKGNSNIYAYNGQKAFDLWYGMSNVYDDGVYVTFDKSFTGTVRGIVEYGGEDRIANVENWTDKAKLTIDSGVFDVTFADASLSDNSALEDANINISGGTFTSKIDDYVVDGYKAYTVTGGYKVAPKTTKIELSASTLNLEVGKTSSLKATLTPSTTLDEVVYTSSDDKVATVDKNTGVVTALAAGTTTITAKAGEKTATCVVTVNPVKVETPTIDTTKPVEEVTVGVNDKASQEVISDMAGSIVADIAAGKDVASVDKKTADAVKVAVAEDQTITTEVKVEKIDADKVDEKAKDTIIKLVVEETKDGKTSTVVEYLDLSILLKADDEVLGTVNELDKEVSFTVAIPEELVKDGRVFYVVRVHEGKAEKLPVTMNEDGTITFKTDKFSTYALVYEDAATTTPDTKPTPDPKPTETPKDDKVDTSDNSVAGIYASVCGMALLAGGIVVLKKKKENLMNK